MDSTIASRFGAIYHELREGVPPAPGSTRRKECLPRSSCSIDSRATCSVAMRAPSPPMRLALELAKRAIAEGLDEKLTRDQRVFLYMPFQHSEDRDDQARAIALYACSASRSISISRSGIRRWSIASIGSRIATRFSGGLDGGGAELPHRA